MNAEQQRPDLIDPANDPPWPPRTDGASAQDAFRVPFSVGIGLSLVLWTFIAQLVVGVFAASLGVDLDDPGHLRVMIIAAQLVTLGGIFGGLARTGRLSWRLAGPTRPSPRDLGRGVVVGLVGYGLVLTIAGLWSVLVGDPEPVQQSLLEGVDTSGFVIVASFVAAVGLAPVVEELVFRGVLFQAARRAGGLPFGLALSSLVFVSVHVDFYPPLGTFQPVPLLALTALAVWLAVSFHRSGSLVVPMVGHAVFNAINLTLATWFAP